MQQNNLENAISLFTLELLPTCHEIFSESFGGNLHENFALAKLHEILHHYV